MPQTQIIPKENGCREFTASRGLYANLDVRVSACFVEKNTCESTSINKSDAYETVPCVERYVKYLGKCKGKGEVEGGCDGKESEAGLHSSACSMPGPVLRARDTDMSK